MQLINKETTEIIKWVDRRIKYEEDLKQQLNEWNKIDERSNPPVPRINKAEVLRNNNIIKVQFLVLLNIEMKKRQEEEKKELILTHKSLEICCKEIRRITEVRKEKELAFDINEATIINSWDSDLQVHRSFYKIWENDRKLIFEEEYNIPERKKNASYKIRKKKKKIKLKWKVMDKFIEFIKKKNLNRISNQSSELIWNEFKKECQFEQRRRDVVLEEIRIGYSWDLDVLAIVNKKLVKEITQKREGFRFQ
jgi:hypothetical protein